MTSDTIVLSLGSSFHPGEPTDPMLEHIPVLQGVSFARPAVDIAHLPTCRIRAVAPTALLIHETPTRKMTRVIPALKIPPDATERLRQWAASQQGAPLPPARPGRRVAHPPDDFYFGGRTLAMCGHETQTPLWEEGHSACPACWAKSHCRADFCSGVPIWGDRCGYWWCAEHEGGAVLMTLGGDLGYPTLPIVGADMNIYGRRDNWLYFAKSACYGRQDLLRAAILSATRARLLRPGEERRPLLSDVITGKEGEVRRP